MERTKKSDEIPVRTWLYRESKGKARIEEMKCIYLSQDRTLRARATLFSLCESMVGQGQGRKCEGLRWRQ